MICHCPSLCSSLPELLRSINRVAMATSSFPLTPCEQSHRISSDREFKCQHNSRYCHVGLKKETGCLIFAIFN